MEYDYKTEGKRKSKTVATRKTGVEPKTDKTERNGTEEELDTREPQFRALIENAQDAIVILNPDMTIRYESPSMARITGRKAEDRIGKNPLDFCYPDDIEKMVEEFIPLLEGKIPVVRTDVRLQHESGELLDLELIGTNLSDDPAVGGIVLNLRDITERKRVEEEIQRKTAIVDAINNVFRDTLICETVEEVAYTCINMAERLTGSKYGFIGEINKEGHFNTISFGDLGWAICKMPESNAITLSRNMVIRGIWGRAILKGESQIVNELTSHHNSVSFPEGHPQITRFMGIPLKHVGKIIGMIGLANKEGSYTLVDKESIEYLSVAFVEALRRKRVEEERLQAVTERAAIIDAMGDGLITIGMDGKILSMNPAMERMSGYSRDEFINKDTTSLIHYIKPEDQERISDILVATLEGTIYGGATFTILNRNGQEVPVFTTASFISDAEGKPTTIVVIFKNISKIKEAEEALRESEERFRTVADFAYDWETWKGNDGNLLYVSPSCERITGHKASEFYQDPELLVKITHADDREMVSRHIREEMQSDEVHSLEFRVMTVSGEERWISHICQSVYSADGSPLGRRASNRDVTQRKRAEEKEKELQQELTLTSRLATVGEMASGIAHEINNPLTAVVGYAGLLLKKDIPDDLRENVNFIYEGAKHVASITNRMLTFARQQKPELIAVNVNDIIETTLAMRAYEMESGNIKVATQLASDMPLTLADAGQLQQVFLNIVLNAEIEMINAHGKGSLSIKTERIDNTIRISFEDDGPGILKENLERIFDPFFTTRQVGKGAGLGLSVSHGIVKKHGGRIYAQSRLGKGATFFIELPIITKAKKLKFAEPIAVEIKRVSKARILVVDDDSLVQQFLTEVLDEEGYEVEIAENGEDALKRIGSEDYDVILLDVKLPGMSGIELYKYMQKAVKSLARRVIFMSGDMMSKDTRTFLSRTRAPYINKPFDDEEIKKAIYRLSGKGA